MFKSIHPGIGLVLTTAVLLVAALACGPDEPPFVVNLDVRSEAVGLKSYPPGRFKEATDTAIAVQNRHDTLFWRQPGITGVGVGFLLTSDGRYTEEIGIIVEVKEMVDQESLPPKDRIPEILDGVRVQIHTGKFERVVD